MLLLDYKFILVEFGIFKIRNGILYSWKVDFVDYTRNCSVFAPFLFGAFLPLLNFITFMDFQNVFGRKSICICVGLLLQTSGYIPQAVQVRI
jgi:hypothetical protein